MKKIIVLAAAALVPAAFAQNNPRAAAPPQSNTVVVTRGQTIATAVAGMAKAAGAIVAVDPDIKGNVSGATAKLPLEQGLDTIAKENHAIWRKVYLSENEIPHLADGTVDGRRLKRLISGLDAVTTANIGVVNPATGRMTVVSQDLETSASMREWAKTRKAVYLLYLPGEAAKPAAGILGGVDALKDMTPDQRMQWMKEHGGVVVSSDMTPEQRAQALQALPPDERARIEDKMNQAAQNGASNMMIMIQKDQTKQ